jgi:cytochrome c oxidase subunit II
MSLGKRKKRLGVLLGASLLSGCGVEWNMTPGVTPMSREIYDLHMLVLWICVAIGVVVFGAMFYAIWRHRKSVGAVPARFHEHTGVEIAWTIVPLVILIGMAIPATVTLIAMEDTSDADVTIMVTGYQFRWSYDYLEDEIRFFSNLATPPEEMAGQVAKSEAYLREVDNPLVLPVNRKVRFLITANDVIHSWWVPALGFKKDAVPGFINEAWALIEQPGIYRGQCAELCGVGHAYMPIVVRAVTEEEYAQWIGEQREAIAAAEAAAEREWPVDELMARGQQIYNAYCASCHMVDGAGVTGVFPAITGGQRTTGPVAGHIDVVVRGVQGTAMVPFGPVLNDADIAAVITYERNALGNDMGDIVQPHEIRAAR